MINELHLLWVPNFIAIGIYFLFGTKFSWNEETDTCFNVECVLLGRNFDFLGGYLVVTARYLMVTTGQVAARYLVVTARCWWLLVVTAHYCSFPLLVCMGFYSKYMRWIFRVRPEKLILISFFILKFSDLNVDGFFIFSYIRYHHFVNSKHIQWIGLLFCQERS